MSQTATETVAAPSIELSRLDNVSPSPTFTSLPVEQTELDNSAPSISSAAEDESNYPTGRKRAVMLAAYALGLGLHRTTSHLTYF